MYTQDVLLTTHNMSTTILSRVRDGMAAYIRAERNNYGCLETLRLAVISEFIHLFPSKGECVRAVDTVLESTIPNYWQQLTAEKMHADDVCNDPDLFE